MADPFGRGGSSSGGGSSDPFGRKGPAPSKGGGGIGGFFGHAGHWIASKAGLAAHDIKSIPGGAIQFTKANIDDLKHGKSFVTDPADVLRGKSEVGKLAHQMVKQTAETVLHPLRDPFQTALLVSPVGHGVGAAIERGAAGAEAARAGEGAAGAAKALVRSPEVKPRVLKSGGGEASLIPSKNAGGRLIQRGYDKTLQKALDEKPGGRVAAHAQKRIGGAQDEEARLQQKMRAVPSALLDKAAGKLSKLPAARREEQAALELTSANTTAEDAAKYHLDQAAKGVNPARNNVVARLYQRVADRGLLTKNETGDVVVDAAKHPKLAKTDEALARVQKRGDQILVEKGVREPAALQSRVDAPGRIRAGAKYEAPTPGKAGVSPALDVAKAERDRLAAIHERALAQEEKWHNESRTRDLGALSETDAKTRLAQLDAEHAALIKKLVPASSQYGGDVSKAEQLRRNSENARAGKGNRVGARKLPTVSAEEQALADSKLREVVANNPSHPVAQKAAALLAERDQLRAALNNRAEAAFSGEESKPLPSAPASAHASVPRASNPYRNRIVQIGTRLEAAQAKVDRLQTAAERRVKPTGIVGGETARPGRGFISGRVSEKKLSKAEASASRGEVIGAAKAPIDAKPYTGRALEQGLVPKHVTASASNHFRSILKFVNTDARRRAALATGSAVRRSERDVLVREPDVAAEKIGRQVEEALGRQRSTVDTTEELATEEGLRAAHQMFLEHLIPGLKDRFAGDKGAKVGIEAPAGYKWVDKGALGDLTKAAPGPRGKIAKSVDTANSAVTAMTVYFKVGHIGTRVLTNASTNIIQGSAAPLQAKRSFQMWESLSEEQKARALAASGQHGFSSLPHEGNNVVARAAGRGAQWWAKNADATFRFNSLAYELRKIGYDAPHSFVKALDALQSGGHGLSGSEWAKLSAAARRADREAISYDRLNDFERRYITRAIWFYPWIKGSTLFTVRTALEHPFKSAALGALGVQGRQAQERDLGPVPSYEGGLVKVGGGGMPNVTDFSTFSPFATAADVLEAPTLPGAAAGFLNPVAGAAGQFTYGLNSYGGPSKSPITDALLALGSATPEQQFAEAVAAQGKDQSNRMFRKTPWSTLERYLVGPALPRRVNLAALAKAAAREKAGGR